MEAILSIDSKFVPLIAHINVTSFLLRNIRVSLVQGSMFWRLNVVAVAFLINFDKKNSQPVVFSYIDSQSILFKKIFSLNVLMIHHNGTVAR